MPSLCDFVFGNGFLNMTPKAHKKKQKKKFVNWTSSKLKSFFHPRTLLRE